MMFSTRSRSAVRKGVSPWVTFASRAKEPPDRESPTEPEKIPKSPKLTNESLKRGDRKKRSSSQRACHQFSETRRIWLNQVLGLGADAKARTDRDAWKATTRDKGLTHFAESGPCSGGYSAIETSASCSTSCGTASTRDLTQACPTQR